MIAYIWERLRRNWRGMSLAVTGILAVAITTVVLDLLGKRWVAALQASTTFLLLLATGTYAYLTWRLVRATEDPPAVRLAAERAAVEALARSTLREGTDLDRLREFFPLDATAGFPSKSFFDMNDKVADWADSLVTARIGLPLKLRALADEATAAVQRAALAILTLDTAIMIERHEADADGRDPEWSKVEIRYEAARLARANVDDTVQWGEFVQGRPVANAIEQVRILSRAADMYLLGGRS